MGLINFLFDPVTRGPAVALFFLGALLGLVGLFLCLRKESLLGEVLSHTLYPGVLIGTITASLLDVSEEVELIFLIMCGFFFAWVSLSLFNWMKKRFKIGVDERLSFVLSFFFAIGMLYASYIQNIYPQSYRRSLTLFFGQAATLKDIDALRYALFFFITLFIVFIFRRLWILDTIDPGYRQIHIATHKLVDVLWIFLLALAIVLSMRSVGALMMSALLVLPWAISRIICKSLFNQVFFSIFWGGIIGFLGVFVSDWMGSHTDMVFPTGPVGVVLGCFFLFSLYLLYPSQGALWKWLKKQKFYFQVLEENILKSLWYQETGNSIVEIASYFHKNSFFIKIFLIFLERKKYIFIDGELVFLTDIGKKAGGRIVRLHRLWELYLFRCIGMKKELVHKSAEEMEHILSDDMEVELEKILGDPTFDPHARPIPEKEN